MTFKPRAKKQLAKVRTALLRLVSALLMATLPCDRGVTAFVVSARA